MVLKLREIQFAVNVSVLLDDMVSRVSPFQLVFDRKRGSISGKDIIIPFPNKLATTTTVTEYPPKRERNIRETETHVCKTTR